MQVLTTVPVGMSDIRVLKSHGVFTCLGLGSCVGLCALDPISGVAGMVHLMLPEAFIDKPLDKPGKFASTGIPAMFAQMEELGALRRRLIAAYVGGAQVFRYGPSLGGRMDIGARNVESVRSILDQQGIRVIASDVGGQQGRTVKFDVETGAITVRTVSAGEKMLCNLRG